MTLTEQAAVDGSTSKRIGNAKAQSSKIWTPVSHARSRAIPTSGHHGGIHAPSLSDRAFHVVARSGATTSPSTTSLTAMSCRATPLQPLSDELHRRLEPLHCGSPASAKTVASRSTA